MARFNVAVVGCGGMSYAWIVPLKARPDVEIVALVDLVKENAEAKKAQHGLDSARVFTTLTEALEKCSINLVVDVTIPEAHFTTVTTALKGGCDVIGEKPMANSLEEAVEMVNTVDKTGKTYAVMQNRRYLDFLISFANLTKEKTLGPLGQLSADFFIGAHFGGFRDLMDSPLILDMSIHTFDSARHISQSDAVSVYCKEFNPSWSWYKGDASAICIFEMDNGAIFDYRGSWCGEGYETSWEANWRAVYEKGTALLVGEDLSYDKVENGEHTIVKVPRFTLEKEEHAGCINDMLDALVAGTRPQTDCHDNIKSIAMVYAAIESSKKNMPVKVTY